MTSSKPCYPNADGARQEISSSPRAGADDKGQRDIGQLKLKYFNWDHPEPSAYSWQDSWSRFSKEGICGDAAGATPEFGALMFEITVTRFIEMAREFHTIPIKERVDHY